MGKKKTSEMIRGIGPSNHGGQLSACICDCSACLKLLMCIFVGAIAVVIVIGVIQLGGELTDPTPKFQGKPAAQVVAESPWRWEPAVPASEDSTEKERLRLEAEENA